MTGGRASEAQRRGYAADYLAQTASILRQLDVAAIERAAEALASLRASGGRLFVIGSGGGAGHASHAVSDFRKIAGIEAYSPTDNVSELTARINDEGWETSYVDWLRASRFDRKDMLLVLSVGGGDLERNVSPNLVRCLEHAREVGAKICGLVGRDGGHTARLADVVVIVPTVDPERVTFHTEGLQAVLWHLLVSHPAVQAHATRWESLR